MTALARCTGSTFHNGSLTCTSCACWRINVCMVWHRTTWPVSVCALQRSMVVLGCDHRMTINNCSSRGQVQLLLVRAPSTPPDQRTGTLYPLRLVIRQSLGTFRQMLKSSLFRLRDVYRPWYSCTSQHASLFYEWQVTPWSGRGHGHMTEI